MLLKLEIQNFALIDHLDIDWHAGLTVITGETGSGKSIMLGALGLILGQRADLQAVKDSGKKCVVEGHFQLDEGVFAQAFASIHHDFDAYTILRREILPGGKSRAFINDVPATLDALKTISGKLIDIHSQHDTQLLNQSSFQLRLIDLYAKNHKVFQSYKSAFEQYEQLMVALKQLENRQLPGQDLGYMEFLINELEEAKPVKGELDSLEEEWKTLSSVTDIKSAAGQLVNYLDQEEIGVLSLLRKGILALAEVKEVSKVASDLYNRLDSGFIELKDITNEALQLAESVEDDPQRLDALESRINLLNQLAQKHRCQHPDELPDVLKKLQDELDEVANFANRKDKLAEGIVKQKEVLMQAGTALTESRMASIPKLEKQINETLKILNFSNAQFGIQLETKPFSTDGIDKPQLLFSANKGMEARPIQKVASGGELSRIMLAIKSALAKTKGLPTLIFDEIDTGIGGETAARVAELLREMSADVQLIAISHLPQIAGAGQMHGKVEKFDHDNETVTNIRFLTESERVDEVARMLSGNTVTEAAKQNARDLMFPA